MVSRSWSWDIRLGLWVDSGSLVGHISDISVISVGDILDVLDSAIGKSHGVSTLDIAGTIGGLLSIEVGLGVVISHSVGEGVGGNLIGVFLGMVSGGGLVSNRGWGISGCSLHNHGGNNRSVMDGMVDNWVNSMMGNWMNRMMSHWVDSVMDWSVVEHMLDSSVGGSQGENSSSNKSLKH